MKYKILDVTFNYPVDRTGMDIWETIERELPERAWTEQSVLGGWMERGNGEDPAGLLKPGEMCLTFLEEGFEHREGALRLLTDIGATNIREDVRWI